MEASTLGVTMVILFELLASGKFFTSSATDVFGNVLSASEGSVTENSVSGVDGGLPAHE